MGYPGLNPHRYLPPINRSARQDTDHHMLDDDQISEPEGAPVTEQDAQEAAKAAAAKAASGGKSKA